MVYGLARNENAQISCEVDAYPSADAFSWTFNNSAEATIAEKHRKSEKRRNSSILHITPVSEMDFGTLLCSAKNVVGEQMEPCVFRIIPAGKIFIYLVREELWSRQTRKNKNKSRKISFNDWNFQNRTPPPVVLNISM